MAAPTVSPTGTWVTWTNAVVASPNIRPLPDPPGGVWAQLRKTNTGTFSVPVANAPDVMRDYPTVVLNGTWVSQDDGLRPAETWL